MKIILSILAICLISSAIFGQTADPKIEREIIEFRANIRNAVKAKDAESLKRHFAEGFTHTHASGKVDDKKERVDFFIKGEPTVEDVEPDEIRVIVFDKNLASAVGKTTLLFGAEKRAFQWTGVFFKRKGRWQVVTTHATALRN
jgi:hypothetical protein